MTDIRDVYQEVILDHYRKPRNFHTLPEANHQAGGHNPLCGDRITVYLDVEDGVVQDATFEGAGCAISTASASMMTEAIKGKKIAEARELFRKFHDMLTTEDGEEPDLGKLEALSGVKALPVRIKCATLAWHTMKAALESESEAADPVVSTE